MTAGEDQMIREEVLVFLRSGSEVLLGKKTRKIGAGRWNGPGGKVNKGEKLWEAVIRETQSETGFIIDKVTLRRVAILEAFMWEGSEIVDMCVVHIYFAYDWKIDPDFKDPGEITNLTWTPITEIPYDEMMSGDQVWLPRLLLALRCDGMKITVNYKKVNGGEPREELSKPVVIQNNYWLEQEK